MSLPPDIPDPEDTGPADPGPDPEDPPPETPDLPEPVREELQHLARIRRHLHENPQGAGASERDLVHEMRRLRMEMATAKEDDKAAIFNQYDQLGHLVRQVREAREEATVDPDCPYFGHIRIRDRKGRRDLFLGRATRLSPEVNIVDWRNAPVSGLYYRYEQGEEFEEQLDDIVLEGRLEVRRTLGISGGRLERVDAHEGTWTLEGDSWQPLRRPPPRLAGGAGTALLPRTGGPARARLGTGRQHRADKRLPEITALIDPEQFDLITRPGSGPVVIRGGAGSGKTTVALHRIAWLNYADPERFAPGNMLVLVWGRALKRYVSHVLPSLGISGVLVRTWSEWAHELRKRHYPRLPHATLPDTPSARVRIKLHPAFMEVLEERVDRRSARRSGLEAIDDFVSLLSQGRRVVQQVARRADPPLPDWVVRHAGPQLEEQASSLRAWLAGDKEACHGLDAEDDAVLLRIWQKRVGRLRRRGRRPLRLSHLFLDEVQDFSPIEVLVALDCLTDDRCATLAGDTWQHVLEETGFTRWSEFFRTLGIEGTVVETLQVSYRSTRPITEFSRSLLEPVDDTGRAHPVGDPDTAGITMRTVREGPPVELFPFTDHGACVDFLARALHTLCVREPLASVALVAPDAATRSLYHDGLHKADLPDVHQVLDQDFTFRPGIELACIRDVKGLEFDYVVLLEATAQRYPDTDLARRLLHVGASRAIHQLWITCVGTPAAAIRPLLKERTHDRDG